MVNTSVKRTCILFGETGKKTKNKNTPKYVLDTVIKKKPNNVSVII